MDQGTRFALIAAGLVFCLLFGGATLASIADRGFDLLTVISLVIVGMLAAALIGALSDRDGG